MSPRLREKFYGNLWTVMDWAWILPSAVLSKVLGPVARWAEDKWYEAAVELDQQRSK